MATLSKLHDKCEKCKHKDICNNKRMVACALAEVPKPNIKSATMPNTGPLTHLLSKNHTQVTIKMGEYGNINTSLEEIAENINEQFTLKLNGGYL